MTTPAPFPQITMLQSHRLTPESSPRDAEWLLTWDDTTLWLKAPDGTPVLELPLSIAHRSIELYELYEEGRVSLLTPNGEIRFRKQPAALFAVRELVEAGIAQDAEFRERLQTEFARSLPIGLAMFIVAGSLFALYCWFASWAPDPPPGHWITGFGWLIHGVLLILLSVALAGPYLIYLGWRRGQLVRRIEQRMTDAKPPG